jgi:hypothetical protein
MEGEIENLCTAEYLTDDIADYNSVDICEIVMDECIPTSPFNFFKLYFCTLDRSLVYYPLGVSKKCCLSDCTFLAVFSYFFIHVPKCRC